MRVYVSGVNTLTFTSFKLWDPELGSGDGSQYPPNRNFIIGLQANF